MIFDYGARGKKIPRQQKGPITTKNTFGMLSVGEESDDGEEGSISSLGCPEEERPPSRDTFSVSDRQRSASSPEEQLGGEEGKEEEGEEGTLCVIAEQPKMKRTPFNSQESTKQRSRPGSKHEAPRSSPKAVPHMKRLVSPGSEYFDGGSAVPMVAPVTCLCLMTEMGGPRRMKFV